MRNKILRYALTALAVSAVVITGLGMYYGHVATHPRRQTVAQIRVDGARTPAGLGLDYEDVSFFSDGLTLRGWLVPGDARRSEAVVLIHGYSVNRVKALRYVPFLHSAGYHVLLFDLRAHGDSDGNLCALGLREADDVRAAVRFLTQERGLKRVGVLGVSMGAVAGILAMAEDADIQAGIFDSAYSSIRDLLIYRAHRDYGLGRYPVAETAVRMIEWWLGQAFDTARPLDAVARIAPRPVLFIHGAIDDAVLPQNTKDLYLRAGAPKHIWLTPRATHAEAFTVDQAGYEKQVLTFFNGALRPSE